MDEINANRERGERFPCEKERNQSWHDLSFTLLIQTDMRRLYSNHTETIIKYFVTNLNNHKTQNRSGHLVY